MKSSKLVLALLMAASLASLQACGGGGGGGSSGSEGGTTPDNGGPTDDDDSGTTRIYSVHRQVYPQENAQFGPAGGEHTLTINATTGAVSISDSLLNTSIVPGSEALGYTQLAESGWYLYEVPGALAVLVKKDMNGIEPITNLYVGIPRSSRQCPSATKAYSASYALRSLYSSTLSSFGNTNAGFRLEIDPDYLNAPSVLRNLLIGGASPNFTIVGGTAQHETDTNQMLGCSTIDCVNGHFVIQCNSPMLDVVASVNSKTVVGHMFNEKKALFVGNSSAVQAVSSYAGTYDGFVVNDPNGFTHKIGVVIDADGTIHTSLNTSADNVLQAFVGPGNTQLIVKSGAPENGKFLVTPVESNGRIVLWGTYETDSTTTGNDTFFVLNKRP